MIQVQEKSKLRELILKSRIILSVETSSTICSTAIIENGEILSCVEEVCPREHIEKRIQISAPTNPNVFLIFV